MALASELLREYRWAINWFIFILLLALAKKLFGLNFERTLKILMREFRELLSLKVTAGSINAAGLAVLLVLSIVVLVNATWRQTFTALLNVPSTNSGEFVVIFFVGVAFYALASVFLVSRTGR